MKRLLAAAISSLFPQSQLFGRFRRGICAYSLIGARTYPAVLYFSPSRLHLVLASLTRARV